MYSIILYFVYAALAYIVDDFYVKFYGKEKMISYKYINYKILFLIQALLAIFICYFKYNFSSLATFLFFSSSLIPLFFFKDTFKNKFKCFALVIILLMISEMFISVFFIFFLNLFIDPYLMIMDDAFNAYPWIAIIYSICTCIIDHLLLSVALYLKTKVKKTYKLVFICFSPILLSGINFNILFTSTKSTFMILSIVYWIIAIVIIIVIYFNVKLYLKEKENNILNKQYEQTIKLQTEEMKSIDDYYKQIRKENHDFQNHCLIISELLKIDQEKAKEYLKSLLHDL